MKSPKDPPTNNHKRTGYLWEGPKPEEPRLPCADKLSFDTKTRAAGTAAAVTWQHGTKLKPYKCRHCHLWHLATRTG